MPSAAPRHKPPQLPRVHNRPPRPSAYAQGYDAAWSARSKRHRQRHPYCVDPFGVHRARGERVTGTHVDHVVPRSAGGSDDESNLQTLCHACHSPKTASCDGGFGNQRRAWRPQRAVARGVVVDR